MGRFVQSGQLSGGYVADLIICRLGRPQHAGNRHHHQAHRSPVLPMQVFIQSPGAREDAQDGNHHDTERGGNGGQAACQIEPSRVRKAKHQKSVVQNGHPVGGRGFHPAIGFKQH